ncbi:putative glycosyl transferase [Thozetella sp. PMI_491]|nr:putative glycosyl transferase [Thozetella sp. PMI_491]
MAQFQTQTYTNPARISSTLWRPITYDTASDSIPNQVHFVYALGDELQELRFEFRHFISVYSAWYYWRPHTIFFHCNANSTILESARNGSAGKWSKLIFSMPGFKTNFMEMPTETTTGKAIELPTHRSDFMKVAALANHGGTYLDFDAYPLRDNAVLRKSGFNSIGGRELGGTVISGTFMAKKNSKAMTIWRERMHDSFDGGWSTHVNQLITKIGERLVREPGEMLILDREAWAPGSWLREDAIALFGLHNETSNLDGIKQGDSLPAWEEDLADRWDNPDQFPAWARDWSMTYVLHGFMPSRSNTQIEGVEHFTPSYVLSRQSNFARAVYPAVRNMYERGLIEIADTWDGR